MKESRAVKQGKQSPAAQSKAARPAQGVEARRVAQGADYSTHSTSDADTTQTATGWTNLLLVALGLASLGLYRYGLRFDKTDTIRIIWFLQIALIQCALYALAAWLVWRMRRTSRSTLALIMIFAALFRLSVLFAPPQLSDDIYRYIWDGRVQAARINPYRYVPADEALEFLRDDVIYANINRRDYAPTIYPPLAQLIFFLATRMSESVVWMKALMVLFECASLYALASLLASFKLSRQRILLAAWHPLVVWEIAGNGHLDALVVAFVAFALVAHRQGRESLTGALLGAAVLVKLFPVVLFPAFYRRWSWRMPVAFCGVLVSGYLPYLSVGARRVLGYLPGYAEEEGLHSGTRFFGLQLVRALTGDVNVSRAAYIVFALLVLCATAAWCLFARASNERDDAVRRAALLATVFTLLLSPHYSWYFVWLVPFLCFVPAIRLAPLLYLTAASFMLYGTWLGDAPAQMLRLNLCIYLPPAAMLFFIFRGRRGAQTIDPLT
jgi:alpha-1,6-mannosyltransferase